MSVYRLRYAVLLLDSLYLAISGRTLDDVIRPELREQWEMVKTKWFPRTDTPENIAFDKRTPGTWCHFCTIFRLRRFIH